MFKKGSSIVEAYRKAHPTSEKLFERALHIIAGGITHDIRHLRPFPIYVERAQGSRKWDVDGHELIDYWMGHGALFLGHQPPAVMKAVREQAGLGTHYGACHALEIRWAEMVQRLVPSAERVRFTSSGTEATLLALRLARAFTGKERILKFEGHFHGWHDYATAGVKPPYEMPVSSGIPEDVLRGIILCPPNDIVRVREVLEDHGNIAAVILEPAGGTSGCIPTDPIFLKGLREITASKGVVLIFDEVITGFRYSPGGAQEWYGVIPDLTTLAKILAGGLPGGAVAGKAEIMDLLAFREEADWNRHLKVGHAGTFNANPLSAAAGVATLNIIANGEAQKRANQLGEFLRKEMNEAIHRLGVDACVYGEASLFHIFLEPCKLRSDCDRIVCRLDHKSLQSIGDMNRYHLLRCALILNGVDIPAFHGWISAIHSEEDLEKTAKAFEKALQMLKESGVSGQ
ncbi:MAG: aspartate aminotransferase family protein [candidate division NC10 bacterium]|nr:aspartate aminotransferase family protein [candidate division NC10 bacterium]